MKNYKYLTLLAVLLVSGLPMLAQSYVRDTVTMKCIKSSSPFTEWRKPVPRITGFYHDTVAAQIATDPDTIHSLHLLVKEYKVMEVENVLHCQNDLPYVWRKTKVCWANGTYKDTVKVSDPATADTVYTLKLTLTDLYVQHVEYKLCHGDKVKYRGKTYDKEARDTFNIQSSTSCDSIFYLHVRMGATSYTTIEQHIWRGEEFRWKKSTGEVILTQDGYYYDSLKNTDGCDSIICLKLMTDLLTEKDSFFCESDTLYFKGQKIYQTCTISDTILTKFGGYNITNIHFNMREKFIKTRTYTLCVGDTLHWTELDTLITKPGIYKVVRPSTDPDQCDSLFIAFVNEGIPTIADSTVLVHCRILPYVWKDRYGARHEVWHTTELFDTIGTISAGNCDSILALHVNVAEACSNDTVHLCPNGVVVYNDTVYTKTGDYIQWLRRDKETSLFTDSVVYLHIDSAKMIYNDVWDEDTICYSETPYQWHHRVCMESGVYHDTLTALSNGCDSIVELRLVVHPTYYIDSTIVVCDGKSLTIGTGDKKQTFTQSGTYIDSQSTTKGCDSTHVYHINFYQSMTDTLREHLGKREYYVWYGDTIRETGAYTKHILATSCGCDSIVRYLQLIKDSSYYYYDTAEVCSNKKYYWERNKTEYQQEGDYKATFISQYGMDSVYYLNLTVNPVSRGTTYEQYCEGKEVKIGSRVITKSDTCTEVQMSQNGCDSIITHVINFYPKYTTTENVTILEGTSYIWEGHKTEPITQAGIYYDTLKTTLCKCDSIFVLNLRYSKTYKHTTFDTVCENDLPYEWRGKKYFQKEWKGSEAIQNITDTIHLISSQKTDSAFILNLTIARQYKTTLNDSLCPGGKIYFFGREITKADTSYIHTQISSLGCDSVFVLNVHQAAARMSYDTIRGCNGDTIYIGAHIFTKSDQYDEVVPTGSGCDSIIHHIIQISPTYYFPENKTIITGSQYVWRGKVLKEEGTYYDRLTTKSGCDSIYSITLKVECEHKAPTITNIQLCKGESTLVDDTIVSTSCTFMRTYLAKNGCDSVVKYVVQVHPTYYIEETATFCKNESYKWERCHDTILTKAGRYEVTYKTKSGCDSVYALDLRAVPAYLFDTTIYICKEELPYMYRDQHKEILILKDSIITDSLYTKVGKCDSIRITRFVLNNHCSDMDFYTRCQGDLLIVDGRRIIEDGEYRFLLSGDSVHRFYVHSYPTYDYPKNLGTWCDSVTYAGTTYYAQGTHNDTIRTDRYMKTIHGCDSVERLMMVIHKSAPYKEFTERIYDYSTLIFGGQAYSKTGDYTRTFKTIHGCDSIVTLHLEVIPTDSTGALHYHHCNSSTGRLEIFGKLYNPNKDTLIFDTTAIPDAGMLIVKKAIVMVSYPFTISSVEATSEVCSKADISFNIALGISGSYPARYELDFLPSQLSVSPSHQEGALTGKSVINVSMTGKGLYVSPGEYPYSLKLFAEDCHMSDTVITSSIVVHYPASIMEANWDNTVALLNKEYNDGRWHFLPPYNWRITNAAGQDKTSIINPNQSLSYLYSNALEPGDIITASPLREGYAVPIASCEYVFYPNASGSQVPILVYPTAARTAARVTIESTTNGEWSLYNSTGHKLSSGTFTDGIQTITMPSVEGCYVLYMQPQNADKQIKQIIVY